MNDNSILITIIFLLAIAAVGGVFWYSFRQKKRKTIGNAYLEALEYTIDGNDRLAIQKYKDAVREDSENIDAYIRLGDLLRKRGLYQNAVRIHKDLTLRGSLTPTQRVRILQSLLVDYELAGDTQKAVSTARELLKTEKKPDISVIQKLISFYEQQQQWDRALELVSDNLKQLPPEYRKRAALYSVFQGLAIQENGTGKEARIRFKEALKKDSNCAAAYYYLGKSYQAEGRLEEAIDYWKKLCFTIPEKGYIVFPELEKAWFEMGRFADAENLYHEMMVSGKNGLNPGLALAEIYNKKGDYDSALDILARLEGDFPSAPEVIRQKIFIMFNKGQYKQAASQALTFFQNNKPDNRTFRCRNCHYLSKEPIWICPQCKSLDTFV